MRCPYDAASRNTASELWLGRNLVKELCDQARLANSHFAGNQDHLTAAAFCSLPPAEQQLDFLVATDERGQSRPTMQRLEGALDGARPKDLIYLDRLKETFDLDKSKVSRPEAAVFGTRLEPCQARPRAAAERPHWGCRQLRHALAPHLPR